MGIDLEKLNRYLEEFRKAREEGGDLSDYYSYESWIDYFAYAAELLLRKEKMK